MFSRAAGKRTGNSLKLLGRRGNLEDNLSNVRAAFHKLVCLPRVAERKDGVNDRAHVPPLEERPYLPVQRAGDGALFLDGARAERGAGDGQAALHDGREVDLRGGAFEERNLNEAPFQRQGSEIAREIIPANHVENDVGAASARPFAGDLNEILRAVIDGAFGAELLAGTAFLRRAGRGQNG